MPTRAPSADTIERTARALYASRYGRTPIFGRPRRWTSPLALLHRAICREDAAHLAELRLLNPNPPQRSLDTAATPAARPARPPVAPTTTALRAAACAVSRRLRAGRRLGATTPRSACQPNRTPRSAP